MFLSLADIQHAPTHLKTGTSLSRRAYNKTGEHVRRHSRPAGHCEGLFWRPITHRQAYEIGIAAEIYDRTHREKGGGRPFGNNGVALLRYLAWIAAKHNGKVFPTYDHLQEKLGFCRDTVARLLAALRRHGFLDWLRRYEPTGNERGPKVKQTSNAFRLLLPAAAARLLPKAAPAPDDFTHAQEQQDAAELAHVQTLDTFGQCAHALRGHDDDELTNDLLRFLKTACSSVKVRESENADAICNKIIL